LYLHFFHGYCFPFFRLIFSLFYQQLSKGRPPTFPPFDNSFEHVRQTLMREHGVHMQKSNEDPADNWQFFLLPKGSTKAK
jgi:hypothetical protein